MGFHADATVLQVFDGCVLTASVLPSLPLNSIVERVQSVTTSRGVPRNRAGGTCWAGPVSPGLKHELL